MVILAGIFAMTSCTKENNDNGGGNGNGNEDPNAPRIQLGTTGNLVILPEGGEQSFTYEIVNPVDGGQLSANYEDSWLGTLNTDTAGEVSFTAEANTTGSSRSTIITLTYTYGDQSVNAQVNAVQEAYDIPLTFEITVTPGKMDASLDITPSDDNATYFATVIDLSYDEEGWTDEAIMDRIISAYASYMSNYAVTGHQTDYVVGGMFPSTNYIAIAFGIDVANLTYTSDLAREPFVTGENEPTDAIATGSMDNYWSQEGLIGYNPAFSQLWPSAEYPPVLAALDIEPSEEAVGYFYVVWDGDLTDDDETTLWTETINQARANGAQAEVSAPAELYYMNYSLNTICVIAYDAEGNIGDLTRTVVNLTEDGCSTDYNLFMDYYNALMNAYGAPAQKNIAVPMAPVQSNAAVSVMRLQK